MCSVQSSLLFLYYVVFSVMSVRYCLYVSRIQCTQCSMSVYSVGSVIQRSMQVVFRVLQHQFSFLGVQSIEFVAYIVNGVHCQLDFNLQRSWSAYYSVSVVFSLVFSCQRDSESIAFSVSSVSVAFRVCTVQWVILRLYSSVSAVFKALAVYQESVIFMSCSESTL